MPEIVTFALLGLAVVAALTDWRKGMWICVLTALLQDPLRKLAPGEPAYFVLFVGIVFAAVWLGALLARVRLRLVSIQGWRKYMGAPFALFLVLLLMQAAHSFVLWGSPMVAGIGFMAYILPIPAVAVAYQFAVRRGMADVRRLMWFYVALAGLWLPSIYLEYAGLGWPVLGEVGEGLLISEGMENLRAFAGLFRSSEIASWHTATIACFLFMLLSGRKLTLPRMLLILALTVALVGIGVLTGRRKMLLEVVIFASVYFFLVAWFMRGAAKVAMVALVAGVIGYAAIVGTMDPNAGEKAFDAPAMQQAPGGLYQTYVRRSGSVFSDATARFSMLGVAPVTWAVQRYGWLGAGLGTGSQGVQHVVGAEAVHRGAAEGGLGKVTMELGVPGLIAVLWMVFMFVRYVWRLLWVLTRSSPQHARFAFGLVAFLAANGAAFSVATQAYGDWFILLTLGWAVGFLLALPVLAAKSADGSQPMPARKRRKRLMPGERRFVMPAAR